MNYVIGIPLFWRSSWWCLLAFRWTAPRQPFWPQIMGRQHSWSMQTQPIFQVHHYICFVNADNSDWWCCLLWHTNHWFLIGNWFVNTYWWVDGASLHILLIGELNNRANHWGSQCAICTISVNYIYRSPTSTNTAFLHLFLISSFVWLCF